MVRNAALNTYARWGGEGETEPVPSFVLCHFYQTVGCVLLQKSDGARKGISSQMHESYGLFESFTRSVDGMDYAELPHARKTLVGDGFSECLWKFHGARRKNYVYASSAGQNCGGACGGGGGCWRLRVWLTPNNGAGARDRTGTDLVGPRDFKSLASANSATPAQNRPESVTIAPGL